MPTFDLRRALLYGVAFLCLAGYAFVEARGVAFGGHSAPERVAPDQLRSASPGSWHFIYWAHGTRGK